MAIATEVAVKRWGVVVFPGSNCELDTCHVLEDVLGQDARLIWHEETDLSGLDAIVLPGGFAHGDYLRAGAVARFSPVMDAVAQFAASGKLVLGICNGFQILVEAGMLPGAMLRNNHQQFNCLWANLRVEASSSPYLRGLTPGKVVRFPIAHGEGNYYADPETLDRMKANGQILFRYCEADGTVTPDANPNGSLENIAGICNEAGNVIALMPHPERASEAILGGDDGRPFFESLIRNLDGR